MSTSTATRPAAPAEDGDPAGGGSPGGAARVGRAVLAVLSRSWLVVLVLVAWEAVTVAVDDHFFPPPSQIAVRMYELWFSGPASSAFLTQEALDHFVPGIGRLLLGWALAAVVGVVLGVALGRSELLHDLLDPLLQFFRAIPPPALLPVFLILFSIGPRMQLATIVFGIIWPILLNTMDGARSVDRLHLDTARVFGLSAPRRLVRIILPSAAPKIFAGLRISLAMALILMVISELVGATNGIGYLMQTAQFGFDYQAVWGAVIVLGVLGNVLNLLFTLVERQVLGWQHGARQLNS
ncbi:ABC transporter permease [Allonocardiopsis opalescens]|uniref:ABC-type nitrate/sulfonate/bicarbonate transport system permease component n=1 Tax=Allonocardiopsis opalescens TaxID=1144618 RepID=A0A2T0Q075_9ACTN|nr:ABC transporter permease [Allonocardiopsis opalescens]PRX97190.1 ABC-type nitrate/sulfonate/bicarbonate transport system permease component [Allonocardiopsis opalescens]